MDCGRIGTADRLDEHHLQVAAVEHQIRLICDRATQVGPRSKSGRVAPLFHSRTSLPAGSTATARIASAKPRLYRTRVPLGLLVHARADLTQVACLFVQRNFETPLLQCLRSNKPADACTGDQDGFIWNELLQLCYLSLVDSSPAGILLAKRNLSTPDLSRQPSQSLRAISVASMAGVLNGIGTLAVCRPVEIFNKHLVLL